MILASHPVQRHGDRNPQGIPGTLRECIHNHLRQLSGAECHQVSAGAGGGACQCGASSLTVHQLRAFHPD